MLCNFNTYTSSPNFSGCYTCNISKLTPDSRRLVSEGERIIDSSRKYLQEMQSVDFGNYRLSNCEQPSKISPVLRANSNNKDLMMTSNSEGFSLMVKDGADVDLISLYGGDVIEFESSRFPLKASEYKALTGHILERAEEILKKYLPIFTK